MDDVDPANTHPCSEVTERETRCVRVTDEDGEPWNRFVGTHPDASVGHLFEWRTVFRRAYGKACHYLAAVVDGRWVGVVPFVRMASPLSGNRLVSLPFLDRAGILGDTAMVRSFLFEQCVDFSRRSGARGVSLRHQSLPGNRSEQTTDRATLVLALPPSKDELWKSFRPKVRNQVRKAEKSGLVSEQASVQSLNAFYRVFSQNMRDLGSPVHSKAFFLSLFEAFGDRVKLYLTYDASRFVIGGAVALSFRGTVTVPWASSRRDALAACPNHSLYWTILADSADDRAREFDFGRSYRDSGTYRFKEQWGAEPRELRWDAYDIHGDPEPVRNLRPSEHGTIVRMWSRLPLFVANRLGPLLRQHIEN